ncbi:hypothetical protein SEA_NICEHOUSE_185 [Rhodococcus phage NiceHouse]|nr:hypothetical protein SEA_NICEHOUSE_185 [Rhodococcus phage NiceHouse]
MKKGTKSLQFNEATKEWFKTEVEKHTDLSVIIEAGEVVISYADFDAEYIYDDEWLVAYPGGHFRILSEFKYSEELDSV